MSSKRILLVDDEQAILKALWRLLKRRGYEIHMAESGAEALETLKEKPIDLIISDMRMPNMNGAEFLSIARKRHPEVIRILLTGYSDMDCTVQAINDGGIYGYLSKPWESDQLMELIDSALASKLADEKKARLLLGIRRENVKLKDCVERQTREMATTEQYVVDTYQALTDHQNMTDEALVNLLDLKQHGHRDIGINVVNIVTQIAQQLCLEEYDVELLKLCATLYGVGKVAISDALLGIPQSALSDDQRKMFYYYPLHTASILMAFPERQEVAHILLNHKAYLDGSGYPQNVNVKQIDLLTRIITLAVDYVELCSGLVTGHNEQHEDAIRALEFNGSRYDERLIPILSTTTMHIDTLDHESSIHLPVSSLVSGMILRKDLYSTQGTLLLRSSTMLTENHINQLSRLQANMTERLILNIRFGGSTGEQLGSDLHTVCKAG